MPALPPIANLQAFEAVARRRSFALAAAELHLTASAISHQVTRLEAQLGVRLLERSAHGVRLSATGCSNAAGACRPGVAGRADGLHVPPPDLILGAQFVGPLPALLGLDDAGHVAAKDVVRVDLRRGAPKAAAHGVD